jgi:ABC-type ATPase involved in cell division
MKIRNKEHQSLGIKQLKELSHDFPNDQQLGEEIRRIIARATINNPQGTSVYEPKESFKAEQSPGYTVFKES